MQPGMRRQSTGRPSAFVRAQRGNSAIEFALLAPVLAAMLIGLADVGGYAYQRTDMFGAVRAGAQYFMSGGSSAAQARDVVLASWSQAPGDAVVTVDRYCECAAVVASCNVPCSDGSPPDVFSRIRASGTFRGILLTLDNDTADTIRIR